MGRSGSRPRPVNTAVLPSAAASGTRKRRVEPDSWQSTVTGALPEEKRLHCFLRSNYIVTELLIGWKYIILAGKHGTDYGAVGGAL